MTFNTKILGPTELASEPNSDNALERVIQSLNLQLADPKIRKARKLREHTELAFGFQFIGRISLEEAQQLLALCKEQWASAQVSYFDYRVSLQVKLSAVEGLFEESVYVVGNPEVKHILTA